MKVLIVGGGAAGSVYGFHLAQGGADVSFLVRSYQDCETMRVHKLSAGILGKKKKSTNHTATLDNKNRLFFDVDHITLDFDVIMLTVSAAGLRKGDWLKRLWNRIKDSPSNPIVLSFIPGPSDESFIVHEAGVPRHRLAEGLIALAAWQAPLENQSFDPVPLEEYNVGLSVSCTKYNPVIVYAPLSSQMLSPPPRSSSESIERAVEIINQVSLCFNKGGLSSAVTKTNINKGAIETALGLQTPILVGLEAADWNFNKLLANPKIITTMCAAARETARNVATRVKKTGGTGVFWILFACYFVYPFLLRIIIWIVSNYGSFDLETFVGYHFTKVGEQTTLAVQLYLDEFEDSPKMKELVRMNNRISQALSERKQF